MNEFNQTLSNLSMDNFKLLLSALEASRSGIIVTDNQLPDNPIIFANHAFELISGYKHQEIIGRNCRFLQGNDREQEARFILAKAVKDGEDCIVELRNYKKNGALIWNELYMSPVKNEAGVVTHFIGVQNDITRRKKAESDLYEERELKERNGHKRTNSLKENEEYLKAIIETIRESLIVLDNEFHVISANAHFYRTFALSPEDVIGQSIYQVRKGAWDIAELRQLLEEVLPENNPFEGFEMSHDFPVVGKKHFVLNARRIEVDGDFKDRILLALEDVTEYKENEIRKDDFLSIASHELRTPLTTVKGYNQLISRMLPANSAPVLVETLRKSNVYIDKLNSLISDLLDVSRIQAGRVELNQTLFELDDMVKECVENIQTGISSHVFNIKGSTNTKISGDRERLEQVLVNLIENAAKYSPASKSVDVYLSVVGDYIKVSVSDYGVGIKLDDHKKIFERFYRAKETQKDFAGIGIGLYVCESIIKEHDGTLWVDSDPGKGSTFSFTLPLQKNIT